MARTRKVVWKMPVSSEQFRDGPVVSHRRGRVTMSYDFQAPDGEYAWESLIFLGVAALEFTPNGALTKDQVASRDELVELDGSAWRPGVRVIDTELRHFRIAFKALGCYDLLALDFVPPPAGPPLPRPLLAQRAEGA
ncbi:MAG: hypothetical protein L0Y54_03725 [Sporichthyaceae bacterium]|nr:hypothetical protein [Sporichthyaceae bacterium]